MRKKLLGVLLTAALVAGQAMGVCAATSTVATSAPSAGDATTAVAAVPAYTAASLGLVATEAAKVAEVQQITALNTMDAIRAVVTAQTDPDRVMARVGTLVSQFREVTTTNRDPSTGKYNICLAQVMPNGATVANTRILHFDTSVKKWKLEVPVTVTAMGVTAALDSCSPMAIVMVDGTSPQTGETSDWTLWMLAAAMFAGVSILASRRRA